MTVSTTPEGAVVEIAGSCNTPLHPGQSLSCNTNATILSYEFALSEMLKKHTPPCFSTGKTDVNICRGLACTYAFIQTGLQRHLKFQDTIMLIMSQNLFFKSNWH